MYCIKKQSIWPVFKETCLETFYFAKGFNFLNAAKMGYIANLIDLAA
jgi:hypothetical protein